LFITIFESWVLLRSRTLFVGILQSEVLFSVATVLFTHPHQPFLFLLITKDIKARLKDCARVHLNFD